MIRTESESWSGNMAGQYVAAQWMLVLVPSAAALVLMWAAFSGSIAGGWFEIAVLIWSVAIGIGELVFIRFPHRISVDDRVHVRFVGGRVQDLSFSSFSLGTVLLNTFVFFVVKSGRLPRLWFISTPKANELLRALHLDQPLGQDAR